LWELGQGKGWRSFLEWHGRLNPPGEQVPTVVLLAQVCEYLGDTAGAERVLRQALAAEPGQAVLLHALGGLLERQGRPRQAEALECYSALRALDRRLGVALGLALLRAGRPAQAEPVFRDLVRQQPDNPEMHFYLGNALVEQKKLVKAEAAYRKAIELKPDFAKVHNNLGIVLHQQVKRAKADEAYRKAIELLRELLRGLPAEHPTWASYRHQLAIAHANRGELLRHLGRFGEAEAQYKDAGGLLTELRKAFPGNADYKHTLMQNLNGLGLLRKDQGRPGEAEKAYRAALALQQDLVGAHLGWPTYRWRLALLHNNLGTLLSDPGAGPTGPARLAEAERCFRQAAAELRGLNDDFPTSPDYRHHLAVSENGLGRALLTTGRAGQAGEAYERARVLWQKLHAEFPDQPQYRHHLGIVHLNRGALFASMKRWPDAEGAFRRSANLQRPLVTTFPQTPAYKDDCALALHGLAEVAAARGAPEAATHLEEAIRLWRAALEISPKNQRYTLLLAACHNKRTEVLVSLRRYEEAVRAAAGLPTSMPDQWDASYLAARLLAAIRVEAERDPKIDPEKRRALLESCDAKAVQALRQALDQGGRAVPDLRTAPDFEHLRQRDDFQQLLRRQKQLPVPPGRPPAPPGPRPGPNP
jgi:tetratricopeptide (TPR) repeat protein